MKISAEERLVLLIADLELLDRTTQSIHIQSQGYQTVTNRGCQEQAKTTDTTGRSSFMDRDIMATLAQSEPGSEPSDTASNDCDFHLFDRAFRDNPPLLIAMNPEPSALRTRIDQISQELAPESLKYLSEAILASPERLLARFRAESALPSPDEEGGRRSADLSLGIVEDLGHTRETAETGVMYP